MKRPKLTGPLGELVDLYINKRVSRSAASISYFLTLSIFPFLICVTYVLGSLHITEVSLLDFFNGLLDSSTAAVLKDYMDYIAGNNSTAMFIAGLLLFASTAGGAFRAITGAMRDINGTTRFSSFVTTIFSFFFAVVMIVIVYAAIIIVVGGNWLVHFIDRLLHLGSFQAIWRWMRILVMFLLLFGMIYGLYFFMAPKEQKRSSKALGAAAATVALVAVSIIFSTIIGLSGRYSLVYGSLASVIILMIWFYLCATILLIGNMINVVKNRHGEIDHVRDNDTK